MEFDTGIDDSGLIGRSIVDDASLAAYGIRTDADSGAEWLGVIRAEFYRAYNDDRPDFAVALAHAALMYAFKPDQRFELLNLQGIGITAIIKTGGSVELQDFRIAAFEGALLALPADRGWEYADILCRMRLAGAQLEYGLIKSDADLLGSARDEFVALLPALREGRWGYATHAKAAEIAALLAKSVEAIARPSIAEDPWPKGINVPQVDPNPLPHWLLALQLALDPALRAVDTLGYWDAAMELVEPWIEKLPEHPDARNACASAREVLLALNMPAGNPDYAWVQYYIGALAMAAGLQADGLRMEAKTAADEGELAESVAAYRQALAGLDLHDNQGWISTSFYLAYAIHALAEARRDAAGLGEAVGFYEQAVERLSHASGEEEELYLAQVRMNLSEAMAQHAELQGDAGRARRALIIAGEAHMAFALWGHNEGFVVSEANSDRIIAIIEAIESR